MLRRLIESTRRLIGSTTEEQGPKARAGSDLRGGESAGGLRGDETILADRIIEAETSGRTPAVDSPAGEGAGDFQLRLLQDCGLQKDSRVLDAGCGPGRGAASLVRFLDVSRYVGMDSNPSSLKACRHLIRKEQLVAKEARFELGRDFAFDSGGRGFDFILAFSVLQGCDEHSRGRFFTEMVPLLHAGGRILISHADWFDPLRIDGIGLEVERVIREDEYDLSAYGWPSRSAGAEVFPIIELSGTH